EILQKILHRGGWENVGWGWAPIPGQGLKFRPGVKIDVFLGIWIGLVWFLFFLLIINKLSVL
ncbi:hypothetical protein, partial [Escherichia coli]|uniref:hypothetical protein n=1 Tax=Escherichia coli TaxID=562 RepID=UPI003A599744